MPLKYTHQAKPSGIYLSLSLPPLNFLGPAEVQLLNFRCDAPFGVLFAYKH